MASLNGPRIYYYTTRGEFPDSKPFHGTGTCITDSDFFPVRAMSEFTTKIQGLKMGTVQVTWWTEMTREQYYEMWGKYPEDMTDPKGGGASRHLSIVKEEREDD